MELKIWVMVRDYYNWLEVDFANFVRDRGVPVKRKNGARLEVIFEDGVRLLGVTAKRVKRGYLRGMTIEKQI